MTHEACQERLLDFAYGELGPGESAEVEAHLESCDACRAERARLEGTRATMRRLEPELPPAHGEHLVLTAAHQAAERRRRPRLLPPIVWRLSLAAAALVVVGTVSLRVLSVREGGRSRDIEGRPESFLAKEERSVPNVAPATGGAAATEHAFSKAEEAPKKPEEAPKEKRAAKAAAKKAADRPIVGATPRSDARSLAEADAVRERATSRAEPQEPGTAPFASAPSSEAPARRPTPAGPPKAAMRAPAPERKARFAEPPGEVAGSGAAMAQAAPASPPEQAPAADVAVEAPAPPAPAGEAEAAPVPEAAPPAPLLSSRTWKKDRRIQAIQKLVREIDEAQRQGRLVQSTRPFQACGPGEDAERRLYALDGRTAKYVRQVGSREVALTFEQLYDAQGRLRYVFIHGGAVNGAVLEHRIWLDEDGQRLWEAQHWRRGRYPLPAAWPQGDLALHAPDASSLRCGAP